MSNARSRKVLYQDFVTKNFHNPLDMTVELAWYEEVGGMFAPRLLDYDSIRGTLVLERGCPVTRPRAQELAEMIKSMAELGIHHRDVHPGNLVLVGGELRLIDWETAIRDWRPVPPYDFWGPRLSGIALPVIHAEIRSKRSPHGYSMFWMSDHPASIRNQWGVDLSELSTDLEGR